MAEKKTKAENKAKILSAVVDLPKGYTELNVREKPNGKILRTLKRGARVEVVGVEPAKYDAGADWSILHEDGGFVKTEFLKFE